LPIQTPLTLVYEFVFLFRRKHRMSTAFGFSKNMLVASDQLKAVTQSSGLKDGGPVTWSISTPNVSIVKNHK
jgi:hypothetical protein